jgi:hypothetical protein
MDEMYCNEKLPMFSYKNEKAVHKRLIEIVKGHMTGFDGIEEAKALIVENAEMP